MKKHRKYRYFWAKRRKKRDTYEVFCTLHQKPRYLQCFLHMALQKHRYLRCFCNILTLLSFNTKSAKTLYFTVFCALKLAKKCFKNGPKTVPEDRLSRPVTFWWISLVFWRFFDPPKIPKKRQNTSSMKDFSENSLFSKLEILKMQKCSEMQARASFFKATFKKHREGGGRRHRQHPG